TRSARGSRSSGQRSAHCGSVGWAATFSKSSDSPQRTTFALILTTMGAQDALKPIRSVAPWTAISFFTQTDPTRAITEAIPSTEFKVREAQVRPSRLGTKSNFHQLDRSPFRRQLGPLTQRRRDIRRPDLARLKAQSISTNARSVRRRSGVLNATLDSTRIRA